jgi:hypothetical protein
MRDRTLVQATGQISQNFPVWMRTGPFDQTHDQGAQTKDLALNTGEQGICSRWVFGPNRRARSRALPQAA